MTDETLVYTALEDLYGSSASGTREKSARRCSGFRGAVRQKNSGAAGRHEMPGNFVLQGQPTELFALYLGLAGKLEEALVKRVWLKSGGYLVIEPTEALTVIDVNTGKYDGSKNVEETFALINREAAQETARQIRLRNLSGIILIDFINQKDRQAAKELLEELRSLVKRIRSRFASWTSLLLDWWS